MIIKSLFNNVTTPITKRHTQQKILSGILPLHLFRIIQDVDKYKDFLPLCTYSNIQKTSISHDGRTFDGKLQVGISPLFVEEYTSRVTVIPETMTINANSIESKLFDNLRSQWILQEHEEVVTKDTDTTEKESCSSSSSRSSIIDSISCKVNFQVELTVSDPIIIGVLDQLLEQVGKKQVDAFEQRCHDIPIPTVVLDYYNNRDY